VRWKWLQDLDWSYVQCRKYTPPYTPPPLSTAQGWAADLGSATGAFDSFAELKPMQHPFELTAEDQLLFQSF
jgi:hypothetical protein